MNNYYANPEMIEEAKMEAMHQKTGYKEETMSDMKMDGGCCVNPCCPPVMCEPVYECPEERVCHRYHNYEIPHITPCNTRIINHHVYRHTFRPCYSCCEENVVCNVYDNKCC